MSPYDGTLFHLNEFRRHPVDSTEDHRSPWLLLLNGLSTIQEYQSDWLVFSAFCGRYQSWKHYLVLTVFFDDMTADPSLHGNIM